MSFLHSTVQVGPDQVVHVTLRGNAANVALFDDENFALYKEGAPCQHDAGGYFTRSPVVIRPTRPGRWHLVIDLPGTSGAVTAGVAIRPAGSPSSSHP